MELDLLSLSLWAHCVRIRRLCIVGFYVFHVNFFVLFCVFFPLSKSTYRIWSFLRLRCFRLIPFQCDSNGAAAATAAPAQLQCVCLSLVRKWINFTRVSHSHIEMSTYTNQLLTLFLGCALSFLHKNSVAWPNIADIFFSICWFSPLFGYCRFLHVLFYL